MCKTHSSVLVENQLTLLFIIWMLHIATQNRKCLIMLIYTFLDFTSGWWMKLLTKQSITLNNSTLSFKWLILNKECLTNMYIDVNPFPCFVFKITYYRGSYSLSCPHANEIVLTDGLHWSCKFLVLKAGPPPSPDNCP